MANKEYCIRNLDYGSLWSSGTGQYTYDPEEAELHTKETAEGIVEHRNMRAERDFPAVEALLVSDYQKPTLVELMMMGYDKELIMNRKFKKEKKSIKVKMFLTGLFIGFLASGIAALVI